MSSRVLCGLQVGPGGDPTRHARASDETNEGSGFARRDVPVVRITNVC
jgi:hypothetical protein